MEEKHWSVTDGKNLEIETLARNDLKDETCVYNPQNEISTNELEGNYKPNVTFEEVPVTIYAATVVDKNCKQRIPVDICSAMTSSEPILHVEHTTPDVNKELPAVDLSKTLSYSIIL